MMMGTADEIVKAPEKGPVFVEDLPEEEQAVAVVWSSGLGLTLFLGSSTPFGRSNCCLLGLLLMKSFINILSFLFIY